MLASLLQDNFSASQRVLIAGMGGGYDVVCGLPLFFALESLGCQGHLANFSSTPLNDIENAAHLTETLVQVTASSDRPGYFPEGWLSRWFQVRYERDVPVWCFGATGVGPYYENYRTLVQTLGLDAIILIDGGVDSLLRGDEYSLASPLEDALSLAAVSLLDGPKTYLATTAFGAERLDEISHAQVLARIADLTRAQALLGVTTLLSFTPEGSAFLDASQYILEHQQGMKQSIVLHSMLAALRGDFGECAVHPTAEATRVWVSPLMTLYWFFDLPEVARQNLYLPRLINTSTFSEAADQLHRFMKTRPRRGHETIPI